MFGSIRRRGYSSRAILLAAFVACAMVLGGGGSDNPATEIILQLVFAATALAWLWIGAPRTYEMRCTASSLVPCLIAIPLLVPLLQLVPLPPAIWTDLPGRDAQVAALALVGEEASWRPLSQSPARTLASLLATIPPVFCIYAVARLSLKERRLILAVVVALALANATLGMVQLVSGAAAPNLYEHFHVGWITGFQASRNAAADVLLIGFLAAAVLVSPYIGRRPRRLPLALGRGPFLALCAGLGVFLLAATIMTGSRSGAVLGLVALGFAVLMFLTARQDTTSIGRPTLTIALAIPSAIGAFVLALGQGTQTSVGRLLARFSDLEGGRMHIWEDTQFAISQSWPFGVGMGGFQPAVRAAERLEVVDTTFPNRAHNDYLEIALEAGILGCLAVVSAAIILTILALRTWRARPETQSDLLFAAGTLSIIALHSVVDYPMRTMAIACLAGVAAGILFAPHGNPDQAAPRGAPVQPPKGN